MNSKLKSATFVAMATIGILGLVSAPAGASPGQAGAPSVANAVSAESAVPGFQNCTAWRQVDPIKYPNVWGLRCLEVDASGAWKRGYAQVKNFGNEKFWYNRFESSVVGDSTGNSLRTCQSGAAFSLVIGQITECRGWWISDSSAGGSGGFGSGEIWSWNGSAYKPKLVG